MLERSRFYIGGRWVEPAAPHPFDVVDPATEEPVARIQLGSAADVDRAVAAARAAFEGYSQSTPAERAALLQRIVEVYRRRYGELAEAVSREMGAPLGLSKGAQVAAGLGHLAEAATLAGTFPFQSMRGSTAIVHEPVGVCGLITPWNWPLNQLACKVAPALAAGCTMVCKPSELAPLSALLLAEILEEAGVPAGVFNLVAGDGPAVGEALAAHPGVDMVSFTGSTRAGIAVARAAAATVKRVTQELGGKSANLILDDADLARAVAGGVKTCFVNSGQNCNAPSRMLVPRAQHEAALEVARAAAERFKVGNPFAEGTTMGPVVSRAQWERIQGLIRRGLDEGARLVTGGLGRPEGLLRGFFVRPTVFGGVTNGMAIAREEIFGPVLSILPYESEADAVRIANDTVYGLAGYVQSGSLERARAVAARLRAGNVFLNGAGPDLGAPFGGYKQSGNGREWGEHGLREYLEVKAVLGYQPA